MTTAWERRAEPLAGFRRHTDPCALTGAERTLLGALAKHGDIDGVAEELGLKRNRLNSRFCVIREKLHVSTNEEAIKVSGLEVVA